MINKYLICFLFFLGGCDDKGIEVNTIALVTTNEFKGNIVIFFGQDTTIGKIEYVDGKHFFYVEKNGCFFTKLKIGEGFIENYILRDTKLVLANYESPMHLNDALDSSYQIIGGSYSGVKTRFNNKLIRFLPFKADIAYKLKQNWQISDIIIDSIYTSYF
jgi:hypothetical protein